MFFQAYKIYPVPLIRHGLVFVSFILLRSFSGSKGHRESNLLHLHSGYRLWDMKSDDAEIWLLEHFGLREAERPVP